MSTVRFFALCFFSIALLLGGCSFQNKFADTDDTTQNQTDDKSTNTESKPSETTEYNNSNSDKQETIKPEKPTAQPALETANPEANKPEQNAPTPAPTPSPQDDVIQVVAQPESIPVLVNKQNKLPESYVPNDLVYTTIPFVFSEMTDKRKLRSEPATAIANLFAGAKAQGANLLGVSAYRSHATQVTLFNYYVKKDGYEKARTYSALPGTSEHETGLAIDVTGGDGRCPAQDCFGNTAEAKWLQAHVVEYGFIIRYPEGKDAITGYKYEPWHLRYVGIPIATEVMSRGITLEEYYNAIPVNN